jgi:hypothetical protein
MPQQINAATKPVSANFGHCQLPEQKMEHFSILQVHDTKQKGKFHNFPSLRRVFRSHTINCFSCFWKKQAAFFTF